MSAKTEAAVVRAAMREYYFILKVAFGGDYKAMLRDSFAPNRRSRIIACHAHAKATRGKKS